MCSAMGIYRHKAKGEINVPIALGAFSDMCSAMGIYRHKVKDEINVPIALGAFSDKGS